MARAGIAEQAGAGERQHRPHPLSAAGNQVAGELGDERNLALHALEDHGVDAVHVGGDERHHRVERRRAGGGQRVNVRRHERRPSRAAAVFLAAYQTWTRCSGGRYSLSPGWTLNALYQASTFRTTPLTRNV